MSIMSDLIKKHALESFDEPAITVDPEEGETIIKDMTTLEELAELLDKHVPAAEPQTIALSETIISGIDARHNLTPRAMFSASEVPESPVAMEAYVGKKLSTEGIKERAAELWTKFIEWFKKTLKSLVQAARKIKATLFDKSKFDRLSEIDTSKWPGQFEVPLRKSAADVLLFDYTNRQYKMKSLALIEKDYSNITAEMRAYLSRSGVQHMEAVSKFFNNMTIYRLRACADTLWRYDINEAIARMAYDDLTLGHPQKEPMFSGVYNLGLDDLYFSCFTDAPYQAKQQINDEINKIDHDGVQYKSSELDDVISRVTGRKSESFITTVRHIDHVYPEHASAYLYKGKYKQLLDHYTQMTKLAVDLSASIEGVSSTLEKITDNLTTLTISDATKDTEFSGRVDNHTFRVWKRNALYGMYHQYVLTINAVGIQIVRMANETLDFAERMAAAAETATK